MLHLLIQSHLLICHDNSGGLSMTIKNIQDLHAVPQP